MRSSHSKKSNKHIFVILLAILIISSGVSLAFAAEWSIGDQLVPKCTGEKGECTWADLIVLANNVVRFLVYISALLAVMAFCYAGFLYITAFGESGKVEQAHSIFKSTLVGVFFVLAGWLIIATILKILVVSDTTGIGKIVPFQGVKTIQGQQ